MVELHVAGVIRLDAHHRLVKLIVVALVQLWRELQVYIENKTSFVLIIHPMIE